MSTSFIFESYSKQVLRISNESYTEVGVVGNKISDQTMSKSKVFFTF